MAEPFLDTVLSLSHITQQPYGVSATICILAQKSKRRCRLGLQNPASQLQSPLPRTTILPAGQPRTSAGVLMH